MRRKTLYLFMISSFPDFLVQVKLRRRTKGEVWEVVSPKDTDETLSVFTSHKQVDKNDDELKYTLVHPIHFY